MNIYSQAQFAVSKLYSSSFVFRAFQNKCMAKQPFLEVKSYTLWFK